MLKTLLKKQMMEIFRGYFYNSRKNQARSKTATVGYFVMFFFLLVVVIGGMFTALSAFMCYGMAKVGMSWLYFAIMSMMAVVMGTFGSVFNTFSTLYLAKDNDQLLSLPIPVRIIMITRLLGVYIMSLLYSGMVMIPAVVVYLIIVKPSVASVIGCVLLVLLVSVFVLTLSCALGWVVAKISLKLKNKSFVSVIISLLFFGAYYLFFNKSEEIINDLVTNAATYGRTVQSVAYPVYILGSVGTGNVISMLIVTAVVALLFAVMCVLISRSFIKIATSTGTSVKKKYKRTAVKQMSVSKALFFKELKRFTSSSAYMLNCGFGIILLPAFAVFAIIKGSKMFEYFGTEGGLPFVIVCGTLCAMVSMIDITAPSVSLEGKSIWLAQSLPVTPWQVLRSKLAVQIVLSIIPTLICNIILLFVVPMNVFESVFLFVMPLLFILLSAQFGLFLGTKMANLNWTNEIMPIKQSACVFIALFAGLGFALVFIIAYFPAVILIGPQIGLIAYICGFATLTIVLNIMLYMWLKKKGSKIFAAL